MSTSSVFSASILLLMLSGCGPDLGDHIDALGGDPDQRERAKHELLLAKDQAVESLLGALAEPDRKGRAELADVLVSLMYRVEDERIGEALRRHLVEDADADVRARIAQKVGTLKKVEFATDFLRATQDSAAPVRRYAVAGLAALTQTLDAEMLERFRFRARELMSDQSEEVRIEAMFVVEDYLVELVDEAKGQALKANLEAAEGIFAQALDFHPASKRVNYFLGRFYIENDQRQRGLDQLRRHRLLMDAPILSPAPAIDGRLDDVAWDQAAMVDTLYQWGGSNAAYISKVKTRAYVGYTTDALYFAAHCYDEHPDSLLVNGTAHDEPTWPQDQMEFFFDTNFDRETYVYISINPAGAVTDAWDRWNHRNRTLSWNADMERGVHIGEDFWSVELKVNFGQEHFAQPQSGDVWNLNIQRGYRNEGFSQWARTYANTPPADNFGFVVFE